jgi:predicted SprT family Zn-dependent metalloprotease
MDSSKLWAVVGIVAVASGAWGISSLAGSGGPRAAAVATALTPLEALQQELLRSNISRPGDPVLNGRYLQLSAQHFSGALPKLQVLWEPRLAEAGQLGPVPFTLQGMFGHLHGQSVILLNPALQADDAALARALSHEAVHAHLFAKGDTASHHGASFQAVLLRLSGEMAFAGVVATDDERANLKAWLDAEAARLDAERVEMDRLGADLERERADVERALNQLNARTTAADVQRQGWPSPEEVTAVTLQRDTYNARASSMNDRAGRDRADVEHFNREVARYNLMLVYPDGLDAAALASPRAR